MVFQDYELIPTKRVNKDRYSSWLLSRHRFNAFGGYSTLFMGGIVGYAGSQFGQLTTSPLVTPLASSAGFRSLLRNGGVLAGPTLLGFAIGIASFGDAVELKSLFRNGSTFRSEFHTLKTELYHM